MRETVEALRNGFKKGKMQSVEARQKNLLKLKHALLSYEHELYNALYEDLGKSEFESFETEFGILMMEINEAVKHCKAWSRCKRVGMPLMLMPSSSMIQPEPLGVVLVMSPWNYPLQLSIAPLVASMSAGNCTLIKPSSYSPSVSAVLKKMINENFDFEIVRVIEGGREVNEAVLKERFDHIFFTGSVHVGKVVMRAAAETLTPLTLELGGKSPCIVAADADLKMAAKRIIWGKAMNCGQTCVAPDTLFVHESVKDQLIEAMKQIIHEFYPQGCLASPIYGKIVNQKHFDRLCGYLKEGRILTGGHIDREAHKIELTLIDGLSENDELLKEEIFGPILPVLTYQDIEEVFDYVRAHEKPLAAYLFTNDRDLQKHFRKDLSFGGGCINTTLLHLSNSKLGFGGVGSSGMGQYHGYRGFCELSHFKSILKKSRLEASVQYPPYGNKLKLMKFFMK